jgi:hypothetical protein
VTPPELVLRLHPRAFRERWGGEVLVEAEGTGWRTVPGLAISAAGQWLHPALWPADRTEQRLRRAAAALAAVTLTTWLLAYVAVERQQAPARGLTGDRTLDLCAWLMLAGLALLAPLPRPNGAALLAVARRAAVRLRVPVALGAIVALGIGLGGDPLTAWLRVALLGLWWAALVSAAAWAPRILTDLGPQISVAAGPLRLRVAAWLLATANLLTAAIVLGRAVTAGHDTVLTGAAAGILLLAAAYLSTHEDLRAIAQ